MPRKMNKRQKLAPGEEASVTVSLKSVRDPTFHVTLPLQPVSTSVLDLKQALAQKQGLPEDKLRLLYKKKPCSDMKMIKDLARTGEREVEFSVMVMGGSGAAAAAPKEAKEDTGPDANGDAQAADPAQGANTVVETEEFWQGLKVFLKERLQDDKEVDKVSRVFRQALEKQNTGQ